MKAVQLPDWGDHLWFIQTKPRVRHESPRTNANGTPIKLNGEPVIDVHYSHGACLRDRGENGNLLAFASEADAQAHIDKQKPAAKAAVTVPITATVTTDAPAPEKKQVGRPPKLSK